MKAVSVLAIDIGTSSVRTALFDLSGRRRVSSTAQQTYRIRYTADGGAELDPPVLQAATHRCIRQTLTHGRGPICAVGIACFWHSVLGVDSRGRPVTPIYTWADARCRPQARQLRSELSERRYHTQTGCMLRTTYWPAKLRWLKRIHAASWLAPADWLTNAPHTSRSMASGTGLYDLSRHDWLGWAPRSQLLPIADAPFPCSKFTELAGVPWFPAIGDGAAGNLGSDALQPGIAAINFGTSAAVRVLTQSTRVPFGFFRYQVDENRQLVGGAISNAGNLWEWCRRELRLPIAAVHRPAGLTVLPFWVDERAPTWPEDHRGMITGLTLGTTAQDLFNAITNATFYRLAEIANRLPTDQFVVSGGLAKSRNDLQRLADVLGQPVRVSAEPEASLRGAAIFALEKLGAPIARLPSGRTLAPRLRFTRQHTIERRRQIQLEQQQRDCSRRSGFD